MERRFAAVDYFAVLGVPTSADDGAIRSAFRKLAVIHHPDKATYNKEEAKRTFQGIAEAYEVLKDPDLRNRYLRVRQAEGRAKASSSSGRASYEQPRRSGSSGGAGGSLAGMRRAAMNAAREKELEEARARERDFIARERELQRNYEELKSNIKTRLLSDSGAQDDKSWKDWWSEQVGSKWMNDKWEEYLPDLDASSGVQAALMRDMHAEVLEERERMAAELERQREEDRANEEKARLRESARVEGVPTAKSSGSAPMAKRLARGSDDKKGGYSSGTAKKYSGKQLGYLEMITALTELGYAANEAESAARRTTSVEAAEEWILENR
jgi:curved DNA-binding protein CbpA